MKQNKSIDKYSVLYGASKEDVVLILGNEPYFCRKKEWRYILKKYWWGKKLMLYIQFDSNERVQGLYIDVLWGKYL
ncbi:hypothetical protein CMU84_17710 [Elizabethkingia anophelis]|nr:hypothetical protein [Elizabethkingia anophelis]MDV3710152.1 hypothetical protein [Elizabethkingia anophelis]MDV3733631.1 hypothetical protein [Elizabethkingia anophelis]